MIEEFGELAESFGYYYELGNNWNLGFFAIEDYDFSHSSKPYKENFRISDGREKERLFWEEPTIDVKIVDDIRQF